MRPVFVASLCAAWVLLLPSPSLAASSLPYLTVTCSSPSNLLVTCHVSGHNFAPKKTIALTYIVVLPGVRAPQGGPKQIMYWRSGQADNSGTFVRPPFRFTVARNALAFRLIVFAVDRAGDGATTTYVGTS